MFFIKAVGIIAEYNPFHNGHSWHAAEAKRQSGCTCSIAVMSGQFTQRGEPAIFDKWTRAEMAVAGGVDLVLELPTTFAVRSAEFFASAGIRLLQSLGIVSHVAFGAENPDLKLLQQAASFSSTQLGPAIRDRLTTGITYAAAIADCLSSSPEIANLLSQPNTILAIEYLRAINRYAQTLIPVIIPRKHSHYHDTEINTPFASASAVRRALVAGDWNGLRQSIPHTSLALVEKRISEGRGPVVYENFAIPALYKFRTLPIASLAELPDVAEGLHHRLAAASMQAASVEELLVLTKSKRYTRTRLQRTLIHALLGLNKQQTVKFDQCGPLFARVLAFNSVGRSALKEISTHSAIPVITKTAHFLHTKQRYTPEKLSLLQQILLFDTMASDVYVLGAPNMSLRSGAEDFYHSPIYIDQLP